MNQTEVMIKLQEVFDNLFLEKVTLAPSLNAKEVPEWDSLMQISLIVAVEEAFSIRFQTGEVVALKNVGEFADLIRQRVAQSRGNS